MDVLFNTIIREKMIDESIENYVNYIKSFMIFEGTKDLYPIRANPLLILQLNVNFSAKKKKRKSKSNKEQE